MIKRKDVNFGAVHTLVTIRSKTQYRRVEGLGIYLILHLHLMCGEKSESQCTTLSNATEMKECMNKG